MGNEQYASVNAAPQKSALLRSLLLESKDTQCTQGVYDAQFLQSLSSAKKTKIDRFGSAFCPLRMKDSQSWTTCCLVSPLMALVSPTYILNFKGQLHKKCVVLPIDGSGGCVVVKVADAVAVCNENLCLVTFEQPFCGVGWSGISYIKNSEELQNIDLRVFAFTEKVLDKKTKSMTHILETQTFKVEKEQRLGSDFTMNLALPNGGIVCKMVEGRPIVVGIQISSKQTLFFSASMFQQIGEKARGYVRKRGEQRLLNEIHSQETPTESTII